MPPRQPKIRFSPKKLGKIEPFELGWHFAFDFKLILVKNTSPNIEKTLKLYGKIDIFSFQAVLDTFGM